MGKYIHFNKDVRKKLLEVFENLKDEYVPDSADDVLTLFDVRDAIEQDTLTTELLLKAKDCEKYNQIMNILRAARINLDLERYLDKQL